MPESKPSIVNISWPEELLTSEQAWNKFPQRINIVRVVDNALTSYLIGGATEDGQLEAEYILNTVRRLKVQRKLEEL